MNEYITEISSYLEEYASQFTPADSDWEAVAHQWIHALANGNEIFGKIAGAKKKKIIRILNNNKISTDSSSLDSELKNSINIYPKGNNFTFIDLFAGIGGMRQGFEAVGGRCVFSSEFEKKAKESYFENYGDIPFGDITTIADRSLRGDEDMVNSIPGHNILLAGFPCQPFSHAGLKMGIEDTRGTLFDNIAYILEQKQPQFAVLENVTGLISHDEGYTLRTILRKLVRMGYSCIIPEEIIFDDENPKKLKVDAKKMILRAADFGVPQNRRRIYIVLWRKDLKVNFVYPVPTGGKTKVGDILDLNPPEKYTISNRLWEGHQLRKENNKKSGKGFGYALSYHDSEYTNTISARYYKDGSECLIDQSEIGKNPRKITPNEARKLQGFNKKFIINKSDVQAYKQFGNSVSVPVVKALAKQISLTLRN
jgi:DNA (cytosine-5)-methyltransferase 1